ncbi:MAG: FAD:protein FMN transferase [Nocardioides sp.]
MTDSISAGITSIGAVHRFRALGTYVYLATRRPGDLNRAIALATQILSDIDRTCSRFLPDSDLTSVNRSPGRWVRVDPLLVEAVRVARYAAQQSDGLVNPLLGRPLIHLGYDRDFEELCRIDDRPGEGAGHGLSATTPMPSVDAWERIEVAEDAVRIPADSALDLGATAKAWAADLIAAAMTSELTGGAIVSLGGDIAIARGPDAGAAFAEPTPWPVAISEHPGEPADELITLSSGGLATSSTQVRRWTSNGVRRHHLLDPRTGLPCIEVWRTVTATGPSCTAANTASTAAIVLGEAAPRWLVSRRVTARLVGSAGSVRTIGAWG